MKFKNKFINNYFNEYSNLFEALKYNEKQIKDLYNAIIKIKKNKKKIIIFGNGGSSAIASHFSVDMTKNAKVRCQNCNEPDLITCFANDYGYENWVTQSLNFYLDPQDLIILISSSGTSKNMINAARNFKKKNKIVTLTGFKSSNPLKKLGKINFWVNSKSYNHVENMHQIILLLIVDMVISKKKILS